MRRAERGSVLLEVVIALALLAVAGGTLVRLIAESAAAVVAVRDRETAVRSADRTLAALSLLTRDELDRRIGVHPAGGFQADIRRPAPGLYRIALRGDDRRGEILVTLVFRPAASTP